MEKGKRQRIPSAQQVEIWARAVVAVVHREAMEVESNDAVLALVSPTTDQWDYFLGLIDDLESSKVNLGTEIASDTVNATGVTDRVSKASRCSSSNRHIVK